MTVAVARDPAVPAPAEAIDDAPYAHAYTGRHDGGQLPPIRTDNVYGVVLSCVVEAKARVDAAMQTLLPSGGGAAGAAVVDVDSVFVPFVRESVL